MALSQILKVILKPSKKLYVTQLILKQFFSPIATIEVVNIEMHQNLYYCVRKKASCDWLIQFAFFTIIDKITVKQIWGIVLCYNK